MTTEFINKEYETAGSYRKPEVFGGRFYSQDISDDFRYTQGKIGQVAADVFKRVPVLLDGGIVTQGTGDSLDITAGSGYVKLSVEIGGDFGVSIPPPTSSKDIIIYVEWDAQDDLAVPAVDDTYYVKVKYRTVTLYSRTKVRAAGSYGYKKQDSYEFVVNTTPPTDYELCLATYVRPGYTVTPYEQHYQILRLEEDGSANGIISNIRAGKAILFENEGTEWLRISSDGKLSTNQATSTVTAGGIDLKTPSSTGIGLNINNSTTDIFTVNNSGNLSITSGNGNISIGKNAGVGGLNSTILGTEAGFTGPGSSNTLIGQRAGYTLGSSAASNTIVGLGAGEKAVSSNNTLLGAGAAYNLEIGAGNIVIGYLAGSAIDGVSNTIVIGTSLAGAAANNTTYIGGISGITISPAGGAVYCNANGQLGTINSSGRYKENIEDCNIDSSKIYDLRLKTFKYKNVPEISFGYIAEDVDLVLPEIVYRKSKEKAFSTKDQKYTAEDKNELIPEGTQNEKLIFLVIEELKKIKADIDLIKQNLGL